MKVRTIANSHALRDEGERKGMEKEVNKALEIGWEILKYGTFGESGLYYTLVWPYNPSQDSKKETHPIIREPIDMPNITDPIDIRRGSYTREQYLSIALQIGIMFLDRCDGKVDKAMNELIVEKFDEEDLLDEE